MSCDFCNCRTLSLAWETQVPTQCILYCCTVGMTRTLKHTTARSQRNQCEHYSFLCRKGITGCSGFQLSSEVNEEPGEIVAIFTWERPLEKPLDPEAYPGLLRKNVLGWTGWKTALNSECGEIIVSSPIFISSFHTIVTWSTQDGYTVFVGSLWLWLSAVCVGGKD